MDNKVVLSLDILSSLTVSNPENTGCFNVPLPSVSSNLPVMVWIYGGGFMSGDTMGMNFFGHYLYSGQEIADRGNVIFVSVAYRLGPLGFLSTGDSHLPGRSNFHLGNAH